VQPVFVEDLARIAVNAASASRNETMEAVGPEIFTFNDLVDLLKRVVGSKTRVIHLAPVLALPMAKLIGKYVGDQMLTRDEMLGLMANMLVSRGSPTAQTRFSEYAERNADQIGREYRSEHVRRRPQHASREIHELTEEEAAAEDESTDSTDGAA